MVADASLGELRRHIRRLEASAGPNLAGLTPSGEADRPFLSLGASDIDEHFLAGGLGWGSHQFAAAEGDPVASRAFGVMLAARYMAVRPNSHVLVVQEASALSETGALYGPGLHALGLDPGRLILVRTLDGAESLRAVHEALRAHTPGLVVADLWSGAALADLSVTRRFNLAALKARAMLLLMTPDLSATSAALTRWRVTTAPSLQPRRRLGAPAFSLDLVRNRHGRTGRWTLIWNSHDRTFRTVVKADATASRPGAAVALSLDSPAFDRSGPARPAPAVLSPGAYRQAG